VPDLVVQLIDEAAGGHSLLLTEGSGCFLLAKRFG
jgi:hypothetical protein